ncbi:MAG: M12 family metallopeptidase [Myxococcota bacterium]
MKRLIRPLLCAALLLPFATSACIDAEVIEEGGSADEFEPVSRDWPEIHRPQAPRRTRTWQTEDGPVTYEVVDGDVVMEGDMILGTEDEFDALHRADGLTFRGVGRDNRLWSMPVKYSFANSITGAMETAIEDALDRLVDESDAQISFQECSGLCAGSHIKFRFESGDGCSSNVGRVRWPGINKVNLEEACDGVNGTAAGQNREESVIMHEVMHALGVYHEHSRCDRDTFVTINWGNIEDDRDHNFERHCSNATDYGVYDYASVMHYPDTAFSTGGFTITAPNAADQALMGTRNGLSQGDRSVLIGLYGFDCEPTRNTCQPWECGYIPVGCGISLNCGPCQPCESGYCADGSCCPNSGVCSNGIPCAL